MARKSIRKQRRIRRRQLASAILSQPSFTTNNVTGLYNLQWLATLCIRYWPKWLVAVDKHRQRLIQLIADQPTVKNIEALMPVERLFDQMNKVFSI